MTENGDRPTFRKREEKSVVTAILVIIAIGAFFALAYILGAVLEARSTPLPILTIPVAWRGGA